MFLAKRKPALPWHPLSFPLPGKESLLLRQIPPLRPLLTLTPLGPPRQVKLVTQLGLLGKAIGTPNNRSTQASQEVNHYLLGRQHLHLPPSRPPQGSSKEEPNPRWVINLSKKPLTPAQRSVLAKGPNFAVTPRQPPNLEYITAIESSLY